MLFEQESAITKKPWDSTNSSETWSRLCGFEAEGEGEGERVGGEGAWDTVPK